ncbi:MAG: acyl-CoA thioesterase [Propionibacteriaceae bacterium]|nr:acyl-CoA thioesterase [Propionibacteriaceae bacterium]
MNLYFRLLLVRLAALWRPRLGPWDTAITPFRVTPADLDVLAHVNNGKYLSLMDLGRIDLMLRSGLWATARRLGWYPVVAGQTITYLKSLRLGQRFELHTRLLGFHGVWSYVHQEFRVGDAVYAHAVVRARFLRRGGGTVPPDEVIAQAGRPPENAGVPRWVVEWSEHTKRPALRSESGEHLA